MENNQYLYLNIKKEYIIIGILIIKLILLITACIILIQHNNTLIENHNTLTEYIKNSCICMKVLQ